jgi:hypothetical protein
MQINSMRNTFLEPDANLKRILLYSTQLAANHNMWKDDKNISNIVDVNSNIFCHYIKCACPHLDDTSIKSIILAFFLVFYEKIGKNAMLIN